MKKGIKINNVKSPLIGKQKYWYRDNVNVCVICGKEIHNRERVYNEKEKGIYWKDNACWNHF